MATAYESLLPEVIPMVPGCPDTLITNNVRAAVIELCEKAAVYQADLDALSTVEGIYEYDLEPPRDALVQKILWVTHKGRDLEPITTTLLEQRKPSWRDPAYRGTPEYFIKVTQGLLWLAPVPDKTEALSTLIRAQLKPTGTSTETDDGLMSDYRDTIVNGTLFRLLRMPSKEWTDYAGAQMYGALFQEGIRNAELRGRQADVGVARRVSYGGIHTGSVRRRNRYGSGR